MHSKETKASTTSK